VHDYAFIGSWKYNQKRENIIDILSQESEAAFSENRELI
jgi:hypothetical protein